jgi:hypothetical protein
MGSVWVKAPPGFPANSIAAYVDFSDSEGSCVQPKELCSILCSVCKLSGAQRENRRILNRQNEVQVNAIVFCFQFAVVFPSWTSRPPAANFDLYVGTAGLAAKQGINPHQDAHQPQVALTVDPPVVQSQLFSPTKSIL